MKEVNLELFRFGVHAVDTIYEKVNPQELFYGMMRHLCATLVGERQEPIEYEVYASWWEHFKDTKMPRFFVRWFPIKRVKKQISFAMIYPKIKCELPPHLMGDRVTLLIDGQPKIVFDPALGDTDPMEWRHEMEEKVLAGHNYYRDCPYCKRKIFES